MQLLNSITPIRPLSLDLASAIESLNPIADNNKAQETKNNNLTFADTLRQLIETTYATSVQTKSDAYNLALGLTNDSDLHNIEINAAKADLALRTMVSVRNKVLEAYTEVMRITV